MRLVFGAGVLVGVVAIYLPSIVMISSVTERASISREWLASRQGAIQVSDQASSVLPSGHAILLGNVNAILFHKLYRV
jgi:hypothetical protein